MTSTVYRLFLVAGVNTCIPQAENSREDLSQAKLGGGVGLHAFLVSSVGNGGGTTSKVPGSTPGISGNGETLTLIIVNGTLVPPNAIP